jgi:hypothetical protein
MFGWFSPKCPVDTYEKTWTEWRMRWFADQFGIERLLQAEVLLPTEQIFPDPYGGTVEDAQCLLDRLCGHLKIDAQKIQLEVCLDVQLPGAAGHYNRGKQAVIRIAESNLADPLRLVATLAHELAHEMLLGGGLLTADVADHEWVTDLLPVFFGAGVFAANATISEDCGQTGTWSWWKMSRHGYLPARVFGYAFALFALMRGEQDMTWTQHLRLDAFAALRDGLTYLRKTNDSLFHPDTIHAKRLPLSAGELATRLRTGSPSIRLAALWEIGERTVTDLGVVTAVSQCLADRDPAISGEAGRTLAELGPAATVAVPQLLKALSAACNVTRAGAARALGALRPQPDLVIPELCAMLGEKNRSVVAEAAQALGQFGTQAEPAAPRLLAALTGALTDCDQQLIELLAGTLLAITADPKRHVRDYFHRGDSELRQLALAALKEQRALSQGNLADRRQGDGHARRPE